MVCGAALPPCGYKRKYRFWTTHREREKKKLVPVHLTGLELSLPVLYQPCITGDTFPAASLNVDEAGKAAGQPS